MMSEIQKNEPRGWNGGGWNDCLWPLAYQPVLLHRLSIVILKINHTTTNYNYLSHALSSIEYSNTYYKIYIYHNIVAINFILQHISMCV